MDKILSNLKSYSESGIKNKKFLVDLMVKNFKSLPETAITFSNIKKN